MKFNIKSKVYFKALIGSCYFLFKKCYEKTKDFQTVYVIINNSIDYICIDINVK